MPETKKPKIRVMVIDVLKPHKPNIVEFGQILCDCKSVQNVNISVYAIDEKTESVKVTLEGNEIDFPEIEKTIDDFGAVVHGVDKVVVGAKKIIEVPIVDHHEDQR